jgi:hypothetical protein
VQKLPVTGDSSNYVVWRHEEPSGSVRATDPSGGQNWATELHSAEQDATGVDMKTEDPGPSPLNTLADENSPEFPHAGNPTRLSGGCTFNGMPIADCGFLLKASSFDEFSLVSAAATASARIAGFRNQGVSWGKRFEADYDGNGRMTGLSIGKLDPTLKGVNYGRITAIYADSLGPSLLLSSVRPQNAVRVPSEVNNIKVNRAFGDASTAMAPTKEGKNPCLEFFTKGRTLAEVSQLFRNFWNTVQSNPFSAPSIAGTVNSGQGMDARLKLYAPFFADDGTSEAGMLAGYNWNQERGRYEELFTDLTPRQFRALTILHEFAHALGLIPSDKDSKEQSQRNTETVFNKCRGMLERLAAQ